MVHTLSILFTRFQRVYRFHEALRDMLREEFVFLGVVNRFVLLEWYRCSRLVRLFVEMHCDWLVQLLLLEFSAILGFICAVV